WLPPTADPRSCWRSPTAASTSCAGAASSPSATSPPPRVDHPGGCATCSPASRGCCCAAPTAASRSCRSAATAYRSARSPRATTRSPKWRWARGSSSSATPTACSTRALPPATSSAPSALPPRSPARRPSPPPPSTRSSPSSPRLPAAKTLTTTSRWWRSAAARRSQMRKRQLAIASLTVLVVAAAGIAAWAALRAREQPEWTTRSPAALAEMRRGMDAYQKYYWQEARGHFEKALALDPGFVIATRMLLRVDVDKERREELRKQLAAADRSRLSPREVFLVEHTLVQLGEKASTEKADKIVADYLRRYPRDPYALSAWADFCYDARRWDDAESTYQKPLAIDPNWVDAQNRMGYLSMALGRFAQA